MKNRKSLLQADGKTWIAIAGEVHNSSSSNASYMEEIWKKAKELGLNTLLLPVSWELIEPKEDQFTFELVDKLVQQARDAKMHIIFLWFGTWKNAQSTYAPEWVKKDLQRFPRAEMEPGKRKIILKNFYNMPYTTLSYLGEETKRADAKAFARLMRHLREIDEKERTVLAVQVENETGVQGSAREHSALVEQLFVKAPPQGLVDYLKNHTEEMDESLKNAWKNQNARTERKTTSGRETDGMEKSGKEKGWREVFGRAADEIFSAYHIASYVEYVASAGKAEYDLPMAVNSWLTQGTEPGVYPSGGPVAKMMEVWNYAAPSIDIYAPDIYVHNFTDICEEYTKLGNPLFIPETATHSQCAPRLVYAIGHHHAVCFAPFGFEDMGKPFDSATAHLFGMDVKDPLLSIPQDVKEYRYCAATLGSMMELLLVNYGTDNLQAVIAENCKDGTGEMLFENYRFRVKMECQGKEERKGVCLILKAEEDTFYMFANACQIEICSNDRSLEHCDILSYEEGVFSDGSWVAGRKLNGDEAASIAFEEYRLVKMKIFLYGDESMSFREALI